VPVSKMFPPNVSRPCCEGPSCGRTQASYITARIRVEVPFAGDDESTGVRYYLESIESFGPETRAR